MNNSTIETPKLKLNYKNTFFIGSAFFVILMLWQMYNHYCPLFLEYLLIEKTGHSNEFLIGCIMAADNILAIIMLPIFGNLSDKTNTKYGKRMPYILIGMLASAVLFPLIAIMFYLGKLVGVIIMMLVILIIMNMYRNPAVALMPDVTPKPLRSKANGIINLVGYLGGIVAALLSGKLSINATDRVNAIYAFIIASVFMLIAMFILFFTIKERKLLSEMEHDLKIGEEQSSSLDEVSEDKPLSKLDKRNCIILLLAILFWFISFNAIETFNSLFFKNQFNNASIASTIVTILTITSIITFITTLNLPTKIGRKWCVLIGLITIIIGFLLIITFLYTNGVFTKEAYELYALNSADEFIYENGKVANKLTFTMIPLYLCIALCGIGWALINANSYPMMVEMSSRKTIGKFTGYYYTFSMLAQSITPIAVGLWMYNSPLSTKVLYIYSAITMIIALIIFVFFKENRKNVKQTKKGIEALGD